MKKKVLIILHPHFTIPGGAGKVALEIGNRLVKEYKVIVISQKINNEYIANNPKITFYSINGPLTDSIIFWLFFLYWQYKINKKINEFRENSEIILFPQVFPYNWVGLIYKLFHKNVKCFCWCHEPSAFIHIKKWRQSINNPFKRMLSEILKPIFSVIDIKLMKLADKVFANSKFSQKQIERIYNIDSVVIYPGIDIEKYKPIPFSKKENYILTVGRLTKFKNMDVLIKAFSKIKNKKIKLKIVGDGEEKENLIQLIKKLSIDERVELFHQISEKKLIELYQKAKIFVLCSKNEPFGMVPVEAMACGTPVIADNSGGVRETVMDKISGRLINMTVTSLVSTINNILFDEQRLKTLSKNAIKFVQKKYKWEENVNKLIVAINE